MVPPPSSRVHSWTVILCHRGFAYVHAARNNAWNETLILGWLVAVGRRYATNKVALEQEEPDELALSSRGGYLSMKEEKLPMQEWQRMCVLPCPFLCHTPPF
eukprot:COSAG05_NODE_7118_length_854_cov_0.940397_2_plen_101_part_01